MERAGFDPGIGFGVGVDFYLYVDTVSPYHSQRY
jgi:hypothetical protein